MALNRVTVWYGERVAGSTVACVRVEFGSKWDVQMRRSVSGGRLNNKVSNTCTTRASSILLSLPMVQSVRFKRDPLAKSSSRCSSCVIVDGGDDSFEICRYYQGTAVCETYCCFDCVQVVLGKAEGLK